MKIIRKVAKILIPSVRLRTALKDLFESCLIASAPFRHKRAIMKISDKPKVKIAFFVINSSIWKLDELYRKLAVNVKFDPVIIICPYSAFAGEMMQAWMDEAFEFFSQKGYNVLKTYNSENDSWLDVKAEVAPDIIFFTNPHHLTKHEYYIRNYLDHLTCYVPYAFMTPNTYDEQFNQFFHNVIWKSFYETTIHKKIAETYARNRGRNVTVTGYPGCDPFLDKSHHPVDCWKTKDRKIKRIIWAPHHLMKEGLRTSNFLDYHQIMLDIAIRYCGKITVAFKPHPIIKPKLYNYPEWGKEKADAYFAKWNDLENGQVEEGDYVDLFLTSDAIIHDSGSFITEYLFTGKPSLFMISNEEVMKGWNEYGEKALSILYHSRMVEDIYSFIEHVVLEGNDPMKEDRTKFLNEVLLPPNKVSASENIYNEIIREIQ